MSAPSEGAARRVGWDVGGAHVKACLAERGAVVDVAQWPCPLWQGLPHLDAALAAARARWPQAWDATTVHRATMTGEMVDLFPTREDGVVRLCAHLAEALGPSLRLYALDGRFVAPHEARAQWRAIASANWQASARFVAARVGTGLLLDIGSTTTDVVAFADGRVLARGRDDAQRLASGELVYHGVVRTPLCALAPRVALDGRIVNVMNEFFATTADVYRLTGELDPAHDQATPADGGARTPEATRRRLARMVGRDSRDLPDAQWLELARDWRLAQSEEIESQVARVAAANGLAAGAPLVGAGCGAFLAASIAFQAGRPFRRFSELVPGAGDAWSDVCAPAVAVALLADED